MKGWRRKGAREWEKQVERMDGAAQMGWCECREGG
jgi:hypothetical protein